MFPRAQNPLWDYHSAPCGRTCGSRLAFRDHIEHGHEHSRARARDSFSRAETGGHLPLGEILPSSFPKRLDQVSLHPRSLSLPSLYPHQHLVPSAECGPLLHGFHKIQLTNQSLNIYGTPARLGVEDNEEEWGSIPALRGLAVW